MPSKLGFRAKRFSTDIWCRHRKVPCCCLCWTHE